MSFALDACDAHGFDTARRRFLRCQFGATPRPSIRPPWALAEPAFLAACNRCHACARACPGGLIARGDGGYPEVSFRSGECTFCGACAAACTPRALTQERIAWRLQPTLASNCLARQGVLCRSCADACGPAAIRIRQHRPGSSVQVTAAACSGCGACVHACPVSAITMHPTATP